MKNIIIKKNNCLGKNHYKKYIKKLFDNNNDNLSYNENNPLYFSHIAGNNNYNNKNININYNDSLSNNAKNNKNKNNNYKKNNKYSNKEEKESYDYLSLNKSTNIEENKKNILQYDIPRFKNKNTNENHNNKNMLNYIKNLGSNQKTKKIEGYKSKDKEYSLGGGQKIY